MMSSGPSAQSSMSQGVPQIGAKRREPEESKGLLDVRELVARFRSKKDLYDYLLLQSKISFILTATCSGQFYLPVRKKVTKDFLKLVFAGKKELIPQAQIRPISVPRFDELSVANLIKEVMTQKDLAKFFPEQRTKADLPDREYFFNIINTVEPEYLAALVKHAQNQRVHAGEPQDNPNVIEVTEFWRKELAASPYFSSKRISSPSCRVARQDPDAPQEGVEARQRRLQAQEDRCSGDLQGDQGGEEEGGRPERGLRQQPWSRAAPVIQNTLTLPWEDTFRSMMIKIVNNVNTYLIH